MWQLVLIQPTWGCAGLLARVEIVTSRLTKMILGENGPLQCLLQWSLVSLRRGLSCSGRVLVVPPGGECCCELSMSTNGKAKLSRRQTNPPTAQKPVPKL